MNHNQTLTSVALVLVAGCTAATRQPAVEVQGQSEPSVEFAYVSVLRDGQPVGDVAADEFIVEEDGQRRQVIRVGPALIPMQVAILVDDSQVLRTARAHIRMGLNELIDRLRGSDGDPVHRQSVVTDGVGADWVRLEAGDSTDGL